MKPIRRELLNGLLVLVVASLLSVAFSAFQVSFNALLWVLILMGIAIAVSGYILFEITLRVITSAEDREKTLAESTRQREEEWLKRVGNPARLEVGMYAGSAGFGLVLEALKGMKPGTDYTVMGYIGPEGGGETAVTSEARQLIFDFEIERVKSGTICEYKRIACFDRDVLMNDAELKSGILRVGEGPGTIDRVVAKHVQRMMETKGCAVYVAPIVMRSIVALYGTDKASITVDTADQETGARRITGVMFLRSAQQRDYRATSTNRSRDRKTHGRSPQDSLPRRCGASGGSGSSLTYLLDEAPQRHRNNALSELRSENRSRTEGTKSRQMAVASNAVWSARYLRSDFD